MTGRDRRCTMPPLADSTEGDGRRRCLLLCDTQLAGFGSVNQTRPSTWWRLLFAGTPFAADYVQLMEVRLYATPDATGATVTAGGTATASSNFSAAYAAALAFDGVEATGWCTADGAATDAWLAVHLPAPVDVRSMALVVSVGGGGLRITGTVHLQTSPDGVGWTTVASIFPAPAGATQSFLNLA